MIVLLHLYERNVTYWQFNVRVVYDLSLKVQWYLKYDQYSVQYKAETIVVYGKTKLTASSFSI